MQAAPVYISLDAFGQGRNALSDAPVAVRTPAADPRIHDHPCYSESAHRHFARMHVAVAPACNIQCNYCNRKFDCSNESRPGVVSERLTPEQAVRKMLAVASAIPQLSVLGIAGPGDALANARKTFRTCELVRHAAPDLKLCLSTNGLALPDHIDEIVSNRIDHVTITINMVDPEIGARIYPWIFHDHQRHHGIAASKILHERQMLGLEMLAERGVLVKVNSVMIPGINDQHLLEVNRAIRERGAFLHNIMPLISAPEHGTRFGLDGRREPSASELKALQDQCSDGSMQVMRHCRQCRADAVGLLGEDRSAEFSLDSLTDAIPAYPHEARRRYRDRIHAQDKLAPPPAGLLASQQDISLLVAVATRGEDRINQHFGHANEFQIFEVDGKGPRFIGHRRVDHYCQGGYGEEDAMATVLAALNDCHAVFVAKIGNCPREALRAAGIEIVDTYAHQPIDSALRAFHFDYLQRVASGSQQHSLRGDALLRQGAYVVNGIPV
jgi:nitrogen fixation protein NifB